MEINKNQISIRCCVSQIQFGNISSFYVIKSYLSSISLLFYFYISNCSYDYYIYRTMWSCWLFGNFEYTIDIIFIGSNDNGHLVVITGI